MQKKPTRIVKCALAVLWATCLTAQAQVVPVPPDRNPDNANRSLFVTNSVTDATSADIAVYNAVVAADAVLVAQLDALGTTFTAVVSTPTVDARDNTGTDPTPAGKSITTSLSLFVLFVSCSICSLFVQQPNMEVG